MMLLITTANGCSPKQKETPSISVDKGRLKKDVAWITGIEPSRNYLNVNSLNACADYIEEELRKTGCAISIQPFEVKNRQYKNIICTYGKKETERIIIGAHYDVYDDTSGADDNASGVAGLLEIARLIGEQKPAPKYSIELVAYSLEEPPFFRTRHMGSYFHAQSLSDTRTKVRAMICLESIGYFSDEKDSQHFPAFFLKWFYPDKGNFIVVVGKPGQGALVKKIRHLMSEISQIHVDSFIAPVFVPGIDLSDHSSYWDFGFDAVMVTDSAFYRNPNYHELTDTIDTLDFDRMSEVVKGVYWAAINL